MFISAQLGQLGSYMRHQAVAAEQLWRTRATNTLTYLVLTANAQGASPATLCVQRDTCARRQVSILRKLNMHRRWFKTGRCDVCSAQRLESHQDRPGSIPRSHMVSTPMQSISGNALPSIVRALHNSATRAAWHGGGRFLSTYRAFLVPLSHWWCG